MAAFLNPLNCMFYEILFKEIESQQASYLKVEINLEILKLLNNLQRVPIFNLMDEDKSYEWGIIKTGNAVHQYMKLNDHDGNQAQEVRSGKMNSVTDEDFLKLSFVWDHGTVVFYENDIQLQGEGVFSQHKTEINYSHIGLGWNSNECFNGLIYNVRIIIRKKY